MNKDNYFLNIILHSLVNEPESIGNCIQRSKGTSIKNGYTLKAFNIGVKKIISLFQNEFDIKHKNRLKPYFLRLAQSNNQIDYEEINRLKSLDFVQIGYVSKYFIPNDLIKVTYNSKIYWPLFEKLKNAITETEITEKPINAPKGFYLGYSEPQLEKLYELLKPKYLHNSTQLEHFKNAFNGNDLEPNFEPLKWSDITKGGIFVSYFLRKITKLWANTKHLIEPANYKQLVHQSKGNETFETTCTVLKEIENQIKKMTNMDSQ